MRCVAVLITMSGGLAVSFATAAFILALGIVPRVAAISGTGKRLLWYETLVMCGIFTGMLLEFGAVRATLPAAVLAGIGLTGGVFVGCWTCALGELFNMYAVLLCRLKIRVWLEVIVWALCLGKAAGALFDLLT